MISPEWEERLYRYITGIIENKGQKMLAINGMPDHIHIFFGMKPNCCVSDIVREVKKSSTEFIKTEHLAKFKFEWQEGFGGFTYSHSDVDRVVKYILNQKAHHKKTTFRREYINFLKEFQIDFKEEYLFNWHDAA